MKQIPLRKKWGYLISNNEIARFILVGGISTVMNYLLFLLLWGIHVNYLIAAAASYCAGLATGYFINKKIHFKGTSSDDRTSQTKYLLVYTATLGGYLLLTKGLVILQIDPRIVILCAIAFGSIMNFLGTHFFIYRKDFYFSKIDFLIFRYKYLSLYIIIGLGSLVVEVLVIALLRRVREITLPTIPEFAIIGIGFFIGVVFAFILNSTLNFPVQKSRQMKTFRMFLTISVFSFFLNALLMKIIAQKIALDYTFMRFVTAAMVFLVSYSLHRKFTFTDIKKVGIALYLAHHENVAEVKETLKVIPDFIHLDLVDKTFNPQAQKVDLTKLQEIKKIRLNATPLYNNKYTETYTNFSCSPHKEE